MWLLPALLGVLALRALIPGGFMPEFGAAMYQVKTCSSLSPGKIETLEMPGGDSGSPHCDYCVAPLLGTPFADLSFGGHPPLAERVVVRLQSQIPEAPLPRTQRARAPPRV